MAAIVNGSSNNMSVFVVPPILPICQKRNVVITLESGITKMLIRLVRAVLTAAPDIASFIGVAPPFPRDARLYTNSAVISAPTKAIPM